MSEEELGKLFKDTAKNLMPLFNEVADDLDENINENEIDDSLEDYIIIDENTLDNNSLDNYFFPLSSFTAINNKKEKE